MDTYSVSKGTFLFVPPASRGRGSSLPATAVFQPLPMETLEDALQRQEAYTACWSQLEEKIKAVMYRQHERISMELVEFISASGKKLSSLPPSLPPRLEVPTAVLLAGVNMPDHTVLFEQLRSRVSQQLGAHTVQLCSKDCNSGMKATMRQVLLQLVHADNTPADSSDGEDPPVCSSSSSRPLPPSSMPLLVAWHAEAGHEKPVVIFIEDFEGFLPHILCDLITSLSPRLPELPVVLVLGVATSLAALHRSLPHHASSLLSLETLTTLPPSHTLAQLLEEVLLSSSQPFRLGPRSLHFLLHRSLSSASSILALSHALHCAAIEHFAWQPLSTLCCHGDQWVQQMSHAHCEMVRATPSFQKYVESQPASKTVALLEDDDHLQRSVAQLLGELELYHRSFFPLLRCLHLMTQPLPASPLGRSLHELYLLCLEQDDVTQAEQFHTAWTLLGMLGRDELSAAVSACIDIIRSSISPSHQLPGLTQALQHFTEFWQALGRLTSPEDAPGFHGDQGTSVIVQETTSERKMRFNERLRQISSRRKEPTAFDSLRASLLAFLWPLFQQHLRPPSSFPLHEAFYFDTPSSLRQQLSPSPRAAIQVALGCPEYYLSSSGSAAGGEELSADMPDLCIAYHLHLECGRLINLFDWLQAFIAVVQPEEEEEEGEGGKGEVDQVLHARFIQAVSELQFLGFIKPTLRKTDHVQRLTWGAC